MCLFAVGIGLSTNKKMIFSRKMCMIDVIFTLEFLARKESFVKRDEIDHHHSPYSRAMCMCSVELGNILLQLRIHTI